MQDVQATLSVGTLIRERYEVKSVIGISSSGTVYLVEDQRVKRTSKYLFALKEINGLNQHERYQCIFESVLLKQIHHQALPRLYHVFNDEKRDRACIVMDYVDGPDLETLRERQPEQRFTWPEVAQMMAPIVDALSYLHQQEPPIVHGTIKPHNIRLTRPEERCMLVNIGFAREHNPVVSVLPALSGYKAPEQAKQTASVCTDIYGLGAVFYLLLTGSVPTQALERVAQIERGQLDPLKLAHSVEPAVPLHVSQALHRAMSIHTHERFSSVEEFWQVLQNPPKELKLTVAESESPAIIAPPVVTKRLQKPVAMQTSLLSRRQRKDPAFFFYPKRQVVSLLLLIFLLLVGTGAGTWAVVHNHQAIATITKRASLLSTPLLRSTAPIVTPTSSPGIYPGVVGSFTGTLVDISTKVSETLILQDVHQIGSTLNGYLTMGSSLAMSGPFSGTIDFSKHFQLIVNDAAGHPFLFLEGAIQTTTSLSGDFYRCAAALTQSETCSRAADGYGIWNALMTST